MWNRRIEFLSNKTSLVHLYLKPLYNVSQAGDIWRAWASLVAGPSTGDVLFLATTRTATSETTSSSCPTTTARAASPSESNPPWTCLKVGPKRRPSQRPESPKTKHPSKIRACVPPKEDETSTCPLFLLHTPQVHLFLASAWPWESI